MCNSSGDGRRGFTLVELLVVVAIIGIVAGLLLPAVQAAREAARRIQCTGNLKQLGLGCFAHEQTYRYFPPGGWGHSWIGDPTAGSGGNQPGGWVFNTLPYIEQHTVHDLGLGLNSTAKKAALAKMNNTPLPLLNCPSRRRALAYPLKQSTIRKMPTRQRLPPRPITRANGATALLSGRMPTVIGLFTSRRAGFIMRSGGHRAHHDGTSNTYLLGEKYVSREMYTTGADNGDDQSMYVGYDLDVNRWTQNDPVAPYTPLRDRRGLEQYYRFGSAHPGACNFVFCDGSVRSVSYTIDPEIHRRLGNRSDGQPVDSSRF